MPACFSFGPLNKQERVHPFRGLTRSLVWNLLWNNFQLLYFVAFSSFLCFILYIYICCLDSLFQWTCAWNFPVAVRLLTAKDETWVADVQSLFVVFKKGRRGCVWTDNGESQWEESLLQRHITYITQIPPPRIEVYSTICFWYYTNVLNKTSYNMIICSANTLGDPIYR